MSKKTDQFGIYRHPGEAYRNYKSGGYSSSSWKVMQKEFKRKKRLRRISRLMRKGRHPRRTMRPRLV